MTSKLAFLASGRKKTKCVFVASVILILLMLPFTVHLFLNHEKHDTITNNIKGMLSSRSLNTYWYNEVSNSTTKLSRSDTFEKEQYSNSSYFPGLKMEAESILCKETSDCDPYDYRTKKINVNILNKLSKDLELFINKRFPPEEMEIPETCTKETIGNSCKNGACHQLQLPKDPRIRLEQIIRHKYLHVDTQYSDVLQDMGNAVPGFYDIILITAASSNHYLESKKLLRTTHANVVPHLRNFTIIYYNLGLSPNQKKDIASMCRCHVLDFPFHRFPRWVSLLNCYTWKALLINAHASHCNLINWMDASIRFHNNVYRLRELIQRGRTQGVLASGSPIRYVPHMTFREMFHFFGDEACTYLPFSESATGYLMFLNEPLIKWGVLKPWAACALNESCMCLDYVKHPNIGVPMQTCGKRKGPYDYGWCNRYDQSGLGIIVRKLFREKSDHIVIQDYPTYYDIKRDDI